MKIHNFEIIPVMVARDVLAPEWCWNSNSNHWTGFHLWYLTKNEVKIQTEGMEYNLSEGDTFLFDLSKNHHCTHNPERPASMFTVYFHCDQTRELQNLLQTGGIPMQNHPALYGTNTELFRQAMSAGSEAPAWLAPIFQQVLDPCCSSAGHDRIRQIRQMMDSAPEKRYSLEELAARAGYSRNQFIRLFRQMTGTTPYDYLLTARIQRAENLLLFSDYSVTEIARMLGYSDLNHFSAQFYRKTGCYPSRYAEACSREYGSRNLRVPRK